MRTVNFILIALSLFLSSCVYNFGKKVKGNGNTTSTTRTPGEFSKLEQKGSFNIVIKNGPRHEVFLEGEDNILQHIETNIEGNTIVIRSEQGFNLRPIREVNIIVTSPDFESVYTLGSGNINSESVITDSTGMEMGTKGSGDINVQVQCPELELYSYGSGNVKVSGQTRSIKMESAGSGNLEAIDLKTETASIEIKGSGNASVEASRSLDISVMGSGDVSYKGNPSVKSNIRGSGNVKKVD